MKIPSAFLIFILLMSVLTACTSTEKETGLPDVKPPVARIEPFEIVSKHGHRRIDNYYWLKNRNDSAVIEYLKAENAYLDTMMAHTKAFQEKLFNEMRSRIKEDDSSVPYRQDDYYYYTRYITGGEYPVYCRKKGSLEAPEEIIVDGNELGRGQSFFKLLYFAKPQP
ncbi:MAG: hypothetical protein KatS3mg032_2279 [Cyclobacteriaceae bacterium]|nr:MAG: hypothetical protein KatS3mg032_2279 [Cyclobacteriaceae bacterium]